MSWAAVAWMIPTPRPYCATAPDSAKSVCTSTLEPPAAGGIEAANRLIVCVEHLSLAGDAYAAEGEGEAARHRVALERRLIDGVGPIALVDGEPLRAAPVLDVRIEWNVLTHGLVVFADGLEELLRVHALE